MRKLVIKKWLLASFILMSLASTTYASKIFVSNNQEIISPQVALKRIHGKKQEYLIDGTIGVLQRDHYEEGRMQQLLGAYYMQENNVVTADNTLLFTTSPKESVSSERIIKTACSLANQFHQESVAVFINKKSQNGSDTMVKFGKKKPTYAEINKKIPILQSMGLAAFSVYFQGKGRHLSSTKISAIEWLTTRNKNKLLKNVFSNASVHAEYGEAILVFKNGKIQYIN